MFPQPLGCRLRLPVLSSVGGRKTNAYLLAFPSSNYTCIIHAWSLQDVSVLECFFVGLGKSEAVRQQCGILVCKLYFLRSPAGVTVGLCCDSRSEIGDAS